MEQIVRRSAVLPAPPEAVWAALTDPHRLSAWLGGPVELDPFPGGQIVVREDNRLRRGVIVDLEPVRRLEIRWLPAAHRFGFVWGPDDAPAGSGGSVEFQLARRGSGTLLTVAERPPVPQPAAMAR